MISMIESNGVTKHDRSRAKTNREAVNRDDVLSDETLKILGFWIRKHTTFKEKADVENIIGYWVEFAWSDWDPARRVIFEKFIWSRKRNVYLYFQKGIHRHIKEHGMKMRKWYREIPETWVDDDCEEHSIENFADPNSLEAQLSRENEEFGYRDLDAEYVCEWIIGEMNEYTEYLMSICDYDKLCVLQVLCTKNMRFKNVASDKGLSHANMNPTVNKVCDDLSHRMGIPKIKVRSALNLIADELTLSSHLTITEGLHEGL